jgi:hypothetical protein
MANIPPSLNFEGSIKFQFNTNELAQRFSELIQPGLGGQGGEGWPEEFTLGDFPWSSYEVNSVDRHNKVVRVKLTFRVINNTNMPRDDFEDACLEDFEGLDGVDADGWYISSAGAGVLEAQNGGKNRRNRRTRRKQRGGEALPMPAPYLGKVPGMVQPNATPGQDLAQPNPETNTVRPFLPKMGGTRYRKGGFVPSIMEPFAASAAQYAAPMALYAGYKMLTNKSRRSKSARRRNAGRKTRRN